MGVASRVVVLASGRGSNLKAICASAQAATSKNYEVVGVVSDKPDCGAVAFAQSQDIATTVVPFDKQSPRETWDRGLSEAIAKFRPDWVVLAGFMRVLGRDTVDAFAGRMINIHPSLLPSFRGLHAVRQALEAGVRITGCTVHWVDRGVDTGGIVGQAAVPVRGDDDESSLGQRIHQAEHRLLPAVLDKLSGAPVHVAVETPMMIL